VHRALQGHRRRGNLPSRLGPLRPVEAVRYY
jgi:hypothetical protein